MTDYDTFEKGYDAYWEGIDINDNPYNEESDAAKRESWVAGWRKARKHDYDESEG
jgi:ribosome modulation factor